MSHKHWLEPTTANHQLLLSSADLQSVIAKIVTKGCCFLSCHHVLHHNANDHFEFLPHPAPTPCRTKPGLVDGTASLAAIMPFS